MRVRFRRRVLALVLPSLLLVLSLTGTAVAAEFRSQSSGLAGTWSGRYGGAFTGSFTLTWKQSGSKLSGTINLSNPSGKYTVTGTVRNGKISFGAVGAGATYTGTWSGNSMSGHYMSGGGPGTWSAHKKS